MLENRCFRLEGATSLEEAKSWLKAIAKDAHTAREVRDTFVRKLGRANQNLTFWFFSYLFEDVPDDKNFFPLRLVEMLPLIRVWYGRATREPDLVGCLVNYCRWRGLDMIDPEAREIVYGENAKKSELERFLSRVVANSVNDEIKQQAQRNPEGVEAGFRIFALASLGVAWFLGLPEPPLLPEFSAGEHIIVEKWYELEVEPRMITWVNENRGYLEFDSSVGRFVKGIKGIEEKDVEIRFPEAPSFPFPWWRGSLPRRDP